VTHKLFDMPLGSRFRYQGHPEKTYVLLGYADNGLVADAPTGPERNVFQGLYSAADTRQEFESMLVDFVPVQEAPAP
jgi:hypothetical protein